MEQITKWKKFRSAIALCVFLHSASLLGQGAMPMLQNIGTIPAQWEGAGRDHPKLKQVKALIDTAYPKAVKQSGRFRVINDNLVRSLWATPEGRSQLAAEYELHAYVTLGLEVRDESIGIQARILGPSLENYIYESSTVSAVKLTSANDQEIEQWISDIVFRLFNRLPIDVTVLAIQGDYLTLTGGKTQNMNVGDEVTIIRPYIDVRHPANGTWMSFNHDVVGSARILDTKVLTSIAEITRQTDEGSIKIGDGIKLAKLKSRQYFARLDERGGLPTIPPRDNPIFDVSSTNRRDMAVPSKPAGLPMAAEKSRAETEKAPDDSKPSLPKNDLAEDDVEADLDFNKLFSGLADYGFAELGPRLWSISGDAKASSMFPLFLFNYGALGIGRYLAPNVLFEAAAEGHFGSTTLGGFFGFGAKARAFYSLGADSGFFRLGGGAGFTSMAVNVETFGGGDYASADLILGTGGQINVGDLSMDWFADYTIHPVSIGQMGVKGTKRSIDSTSGGTLSVGGSLASSPEEVKFGAYLHSSQINYGFENNAQITRNEFSVIASADYNF